MTQIKVIVFDRRCWRQNRYKLGRVAIAVATGVAVTVTVTFAVGGSEEGGWIGFHKNFRAGES